MSNCNNCGAPVEKLAKVCDYCGKPIKSKETKIDLEVCSLADNAYESGNFDEALYYYNKAIEDNKFSPFAWFRKGCCEIKIGDEYYRPPTYLSDQNLREGLTCFARALKYSGKNKKVKGLVVNQLSKFVSYKGEFSFGDISSFSEKIEKLKNINENEKKRILGPAISGHKGYCLDEIAREKDFFFESNYGIVHPALEIKRQRIMQKYDEAVKEFEETLELLGLNQIWDEYNQ